MLNELSSSFFYGLTVEQVLVNLLTALLGGLIISYTYRYITKGLSFSPSFVRSLILLSIITALVIMTIGNNLARAFGLVGAMTVIRFRTAVKDIQDIVFIIFSLAIGMAAGGSLKLIVIISSLFISGVAIVLNKSGYAIPNKRQFLIQFLSALDTDNPEYIKIFKKYCRRYSLIDMQSIDEEELFEVSYNVVLRTKDDIHAFVKELNQQSGISRVRFYFDDETA
jgi:uncharacterized membrane protein YhiD involved in acid resistance